MSDIEKETFRQIGIDLINEYRVRGGLKPIDWLVIDTPETSAFIRSIQLHEKTKKELRDVKQELADFRQEVSDAAEKQARDVHEIRCLCSRTHKVSFNTLSQFIITPKPDPLVDVLLDMELSSDLEEGQHDAKWLRIKLDALGFEIREKNDD